MMKVYKAVHERICKALNCGISDVIEYIPD